MVRRLLLIVLSVSLLVPLWGCGSSPDHFARALAIERELHRQVPDAGYDHHRYVSVLKELREVPSGHPDKKKADSLAQRIQDGRRMAAAKKYPQLGDLPPRLAAVAEPSQDQGGESPPDAPTEGAQELEVVLYSTSWCGYCRKARNWLTTNGVPFVEKDIEKDPAANAEYQRVGKGYSGVPLLSVNGAVIRGFDVRAVQREIAKVRKGAS